MSKLSILKWIYDLGYKKAEDRYYHALMEGIRDVAAGERYKIFNESEKEYAQRQAMLNNRQDDLRQIINDVFHPQEYVEPQIKDRFLP